MYNYTARGVGEQGTGTAFFPNVLDAHARTFQSFSLLIYYTHTVPPPSTVYSFHNHFPPSALTTYTDVQELIRTSAIFSAHPLISPYTSVPNPIIFRFAHFEYYERARHLLAV